MFLKMQRFLKDAVGHPLLEVECGAVIKALYVAFQKKAQTNKSERTALLYAVQLYWLILGIIFPAARMCPYSFPIPLCVKVVPGFFFPQQ